MVQFFFWLAKKMLGIWCDILAFAAALIEKRDLRSPAERRSSVNDSDHQIHYVMTFQNPMVNPSEKYGFSANGLQWLMVVNGWLLIIVLYIYISGWWFQPTPLKSMMEWKSVGMMTFPTEWNFIKFMFQTTNQKNMLYTDNILLFYINKQYTHIFLETTNHQPGSWFLSYQRSNMLSSLKIHLKNMRQVGIIIASNNSTSLWSSKSSLEWYFPI